MVRSLFAAMLILLLLETLRLNIRARWREVFAKEVLRKQFYPTCPRAKSRTRLVLQTS